MLHAALWCAGVAWHSLVVRTPPVKLCCGAPPVQDVAKGSQGAGKVDESLDHTHAVADDAKAPPARPAGKAGGKKGKGRR